MKANRTMTRENAMRVLYQIFLYKKNKWEHLIYLFRKNDNSHLWNLFL